MNWTIKSFSELTTKELYALLQLRSKVFIVEQNCPYQDLDDKDQQALHLYAQDASGNMLACARLLPAGVSYDEVSIGRVATDPAARGLGYGRTLMLQAIQHIRTHLDTDRIRISAQQYLEAFYGSLGFTTVSEMYLEDNIPHIEMLHGTNIPD
jgi:ElaA protein